METTAEKYKRWFNVDQLYSMMVDGSMDQLAVHKITNLNYILFTFKDQSIMLFKNSDVYLKKDLDL